MHRSFSLALLVAAMAGSSYAANPDVKDIKAFNLFDAGKKVSSAMAELFPDKDKPVFVREFRGLASSHVGLTKCIADEMKAAGFQVQPGAPVELEGRLMRLPLRDSEPLKGFTVRCTLNLDDGSQQNFNVDVENKDQGHLAVDETGEIAPPPTKPQGSEPSRLPPSIDRTEVHPAADSPYSVEILKETSPGNYEPVTPFKKGNLLMVDLPKDCIYAVKVKNETPFEAVANVYIDGLSRYAMADDPKFRDGLDLVPARGERIIKGYYRDGQKVDSFQIGEYSESAAAKLLPSTPDIGLICVSFAACWTGSTPPPGEPGATKSIEPAGTKQGPPRSDPTQTVQRTVGKIRSIVKVRYVSE